MADVVDQWREIEIGKTRLKYELVNEKIMSWENTNRKKAKRRLHRTERGVERAKMKARQSLKEENERLDIIVANARAHVYTSRMKEELKVKEKANLMRASGKSPSTCL